MQLLDADGDGRADLLVTARTGAGRVLPADLRRRVEPTLVPAATGRRPSVNLDDPSVRLVDLDGDGVTDVLRSGSRLECCFNDPDPRRAWQRTRRRRPAPVPDVDLADPRVRLADMTGDGLQDIVLVHNGNVEYWPYLGPRPLGPPVHDAAASPAAARTGFDPARLLLGDVDGDGVADLVYVDRGRVTVWINQGGNAWSDPDRRSTAPRRSPTRRRAAGRPARHRHGRASCGAATADGSGRQHLQFLDLTGGVKPYLLDQMDNHMGAVTTVAVRALDRSSTWRTRRDPGRAGARRCRSRCRSWRGSR